MTASAMPPLKTAAAAALAASARGGGDFGSAFADVFDDLSAT